MVYAQRDYSTFNTVAQDLKMGSDMSHPDLYIWGHLKSLLHKTHLLDMNDLQNRIAENCNMINTLSIFELSKLTTAYRLHSCISSGGGNYSDLL